MTDQNQLRRAGEAMEDLRLTLKDQHDRGHMATPAYLRLEEARRALQEELERLGS